MGPGEIVPSDTNRTITFYTGTLGFKIQQRWMQPDGLIAVSPGKA